MILTRRTAILGTTAVMAATPLRYARAEDTIKIGGIAPITGPAAEAGRFLQNGAAMAVEAINAKGGILGKKLEFVVEDDATTNPGAVLGFSRLVSRGDCVAYTGSIRSTQVQAIAPDVLKEAKPVMFGGTNPGLTANGNPWLFRCRPNDSYSARVIADYGVNTLKKTKWVIIHSTDAFGTGGKDALVATLGKMGITPVLVQGYTNQQTDFTPVVLAVKQANPDVVSSYFTFENDLGIFARQLRQLGVLVPWVGSPSIINTTALNLAGRALFGTYGIADYTPDASPEATAYAVEYLKRYKAQPDNQSTWLYDGLNILANAINAAKSTKPAEIRAAILALKGYKGAEGTYNFDEKGDGLRGYNVVRNENGKIVFDKHIEFND
jgi:branched-chain amino acid transport system substrate-binding protein